MIKDEQGLKASQEAMADLKKMLEAPAKEGVPESIVKASKGHVQEMINDIQGEINEYLKEKKFLDHFSI